MHPAFPAKERGRVNLWKENHLRNRLQKSFPERSPVWEADAAQLPGLLSGAKWRVRRLHLEACPRAPGQMLLPTIHSPRCGPTRQYRCTLASSVQGSWALVEPSPILLLSALSKKQQTQTKPKITLAHFSSGFPRSQGSKYQFSRGFVVVHCKQRKTDPLGCCKE